MNPYRSMSWVRITFSGGRNRGRRSSTLPTAWSGRSPRSSNTFNISTLAATRPSRPPGRARGRLSGLGVLHGRSVLYGAFVWACRALNCQTRRFSARAAAQPRGRARRARRPRARGVHGRRRRGEPASHTHACLLLPATCCLLPAASPGTACSPQRSAGRHPPQPQ